MKPAKIRRIKIQYSITLEQTIVLENGERIRDRIHGLDIPDNRDKGLDYVSGSFKLRKITNCKTGQRIKLKGV